VRCGRRLHPVWKDCVEVNRFGVHPSPVTVRVPAAVDPCAPRGVLPILLTGALAAFKSHERRLGSAAR
jgi:hypothetical protein